MKWELRFQRDGFSVDAAVEKGRELPDWYLDEPFIWPGDEIYIRSFWHLNTCRLYAGGLIPHEKVMEIAQEHEMGPNMTDLFGHVLRMMDNAFIEWQNDEADRRAKITKREAKTKKRGFWRR